MRGWKEGDLNVNKVLKLKNLSKLGTKLVNLKISSIVNFSANLLVSYTYIT